MLLPCFYNLVGLEKKKQLLLDDLDAAAVGDQVSPLKFTFKFQDIVGMLCFIRKLNVSAFVG